MEEQPMSFRWITKESNRDLGVWLDRDDDGNVMPTGITVDRISTLEVDDQMPDFQVKVASDTPYGRALYQELLPLKQSADTQHMPCDCRNCERYW
jgi:hypothetical protein